MGRTSHIRGSSSQRNVYVTNLSDLQPFMKLTKRAPNRQARSVANADHPVICIFDSDESAATANSEAFTYAG